VGYFALTTRQMPDSQKAEFVANSAIAGMTSYVTWADIEPVEGQLDFSRIDADIAIARAAGKKITIGVFTGRDALPGWLSTAGVRLWTNAKGQTLLHPGDARFIGLWRERIAMLGQRYDQDATVVQVTICGAAGTLCGPRYPELPADVGLDILVSNWKQIIDAYVAAFPTTMLNLEVHLTVGFGADLPGELFNAIPTTVPLGPFAEFLSDSAPTSESETGTAFAAAARNRQHCAFQTVSPLGDRLSAAVERGRSFGCRYFELYASDVPQAANLPLP